MTGTGSIDFTVVIADKVPISTASPFTYLRGLYTLEPGIGIVYFNMVYIDFTGILYC